MRIKGLKGKEESNSQVRLICISCFVFVFLQIKTTNLLAATNGVSRLISLPDRVFHTIANQ